MPDSPEMMLAKALVGKIEQALTDLVTYIKREETRRDQCEQDNQQDHRDLHGRITKAEESFAKFHKDEFEPLARDSVKTNTKMTTVIVTISSILSMTALILGILDYFRR